MKASLHAQRGPRGGKGGYQPQHNDGSMYLWDGARFGAGRPLNLHWDETMPEGEWLTGGEQAGRTGAAVDSFYESTLRAEYARKLASAGWRKNPSRVKEFGDYCNDARHRLFETIIQVGDAEESPGEGCLEAALDGALGRMRELGARIVAVDVHLDEATPHAHVLWALIDSVGEFNVDRTLREHGVEPAEATSGGKRDARRATRLAAFTASVREAMEDAADEWLAEHGMEALDRERDPRRKGETLPEYKGRKRRERAQREKIERMREDAEAVLDGAIEKADEIVLKAWEEACEIKAGALSDRRLARGEAESARAAARELSRREARASVLLDGYEPPAFAHLVRPAQMPPDMHALWLYLYGPRLEGYEPDDSEVPDRYRTCVLPGSDAPVVDPDAVEDDFDELLDELYGDRDACAKACGEEGVWLFDAIPEDYELNEWFLDEEGRVDPDVWGDALDSYASDAMDAIGVPLRLGLDPELPHPGLADREAAVESREREVAERERAAAEEEARARDARERAEAELREAERLRALAGSACDVLRRGLIFLADRFGRDRLTGGQNEVGRVLSGLVRRMGTREFEGTSREFEELVFPPRAPSAPAPSTPCAEPQDSPEF